MFSHVLIISKHSKADWFCIWSAFCTICCCRQEFQCVTCQTVIKWVVKKRILRFFPLQRDRGGSLVQVQCAAGYCLPSDCPSLGIRRWGGLNTFRNVHEEIFPTHLKFLICMDSYWNDRILCMKIRTTPFHYHLGVSCFWKMSLYAPHAALFNHKTNWNIITI